MKQKLDSLHKNETNDDQHVEQFQNKIMMMVSHIDKLVTATFDAVRVDDKFKEDEEQVYFAHITARYNLYNVLQEIEKEAVNEHLMQHDDEVIRDLCIELLIDLYELYDWKSLVPNSLPSSDLDNFKTDQEQAGGQGHYVDNVSAGFTLQKLGDLIPWSSEEANRGTAMRISNWITTHRIYLEGDDVSKRATVSPSGLGNHVTWSALKDAVQKLSIKKFRDASGFECSIEMMETSIDRYKSEIFDYKELSKAYKNLSEIYEYRYNFNHKLNEDQTVHESVRKQMDSLYCKISVGGKGTLVVCK